MKSVVQEIRTYLRLTAPNTVFTPAELVARGLGPSSAVRKALTRMTEAGEIQRLRKGYYLRPQIRSCTPETEVAADAITKAHAKKMAFRKARELLFG